MADLFANLGFAHLTKQSIPAPLVFRKGDADALGDLEVHWQKSEHTVDGLNGDGDGPTEHDSLLDVVGADEEST